MKVEEARDYILNRLKNEYSNTIRIIEHNEYVYQLHCYLLEPATSEIYSLVCSLGIKYQLTTEYFDIHIDEYEYGQHRVVAGISRTTASITEIEIINAFFKRLDQMITDVRKYKKELLMMEIENE